MTACGEAVTETEQESYNMTVVENIPDVSYNEPTMTPNILVDQQGYDTDGRKQAVVKGSEQAETFRLIDQETGETVYEDTVRQMEYDEKLELYIGTADFSEYTGEGEFYLECDGVGRSYAFSITEEHYQKWLQTLCEETGDRCRDRSITGAELVTLLQAYEWYPQVFADDNDNDIPDLLEDIAKGLKESLDDTEEPEKEDLRDVAALAKFSYLYREYDAQLAEKCLQRASAAYGELADNEDRDADRFLALTELYRVEGRSSYQKQILEYRDLLEEELADPEDAAYLYGAMTYMSTRRSVDMDLCSVLMETIRKRSEELAKQWNRESAMTSGDYKTAELLRQAEEMACANYVSYSYQYTEILEDALHYLMGQNRDSVDYFSEREKGDAADYLLLIAQQVSLLED